MVTSFPEEQGKRSLKCLFGWRGLQRSFYEEVFMGMGSKLARRVAATLAAAALAITASGVASVVQAQTSPRVTVAAIEPSLGAGRRAQLGIVEQEAENATTNGTILPFGTSAYTLSSQAAGRQAVKLLPGQYVAFTLTQPSNPNTVAHPIPDAP